MMSKIIVACAGYHGLQIPSLKGNMVQLSGFKDSAESKRQIDGLAKAPSTFGYTLVDRSDWEIFAKVVDGKPTSDLPMIKSGMLFAAESAKQIVDLASGLVSDGVKPSARQKDANKSIVTEVGEVEKTTKED